MLKLDKNTLAYFTEQGATKIKVFFYNAWCSGMKVNIISDFDIDESVEEISPLSVSFPPGKKESTENIPLLRKEGLGVVSAERDLRIFIDKRDKEKLENCSITRVAIADHTGKEKVRYIYAGEEVKWRCWCGSSFNFGEEKKPKLDLSKLRSFKKQLLNQD